MKNLRRNFTRLALAPVVAIALLGCKSEDWNDTMEDAKGAATSVFESVTNYDYAAFWQSLSTSFKTARRDRYLERQILTLEVPRETQLATYTTILNECAVHECEIIRRGYKRNTVYPGNDTASLRITLPSATAPALINSVLRLGNVTHNRLAMDEYIEKDLGYYGNELATLKSLRDQLSPKADEEGTYSLESVRDLHRLLSRLNTQIMHIESDIAYLGRTKDKRLVDIRIVRESNSVIARVKSNLQNTMTTAADYLHYGIMAVLLFLLWKLVFISKNTMKGTIAFIRRRRAEKKAAKSVREIGDDFKVPPKL